MAIGFEHDFVPSEGVGPIAAAAVRWRRLRLLGLRLLADGAPVEGPSSTRLQGPQRFGVSLAPGPSPLLPRG